MKRRRPTCDDCTGRFDCQWPDRQEKGGVCSGFRRAPLSPSVRRALAAYERALRAQDEYVDALIADWPKQPVSDATCKAAIRACVAKGRARIARREAEGKELTRRRIGRDLRPGEIRRLK